MTGIFDQAKAFAQIGTDAFEISNALGKDAAALATSEPVTITALGSMTKRSKRKWITLSLALRKHNAEARVRRSKHIRNLRSGVQVGQYDHYRIRRCVRCFPRRKTRHVLDYCRGLSLCQRGHYFRRDDIGYNVFCFAEKAHAEMFREKFGGDTVEAKRSR